jgi:hypothetical protein
MKSIFTIWLYVCLYLVLSVAPLSAAAAAGDVPAAVRTPLSSPISDGSDIKILQLARAANDDVYSSLQSFVCNEEINRFKGSLNGQTIHPLDTVTAKLSFERGVEQYTNILQNNHSRPGMSSLPGAWSEGEFGTLLLQTQQLLASQRVDFDSLTAIQGEQAALFHFDVSAEESPWDLEVSNKHYRLPFHTSVWISVSTGEILRIERNTIAIASDTHISEIQWGITLEHFSFNGKTWLLPATGTYTVLYNESHHREWNQISFTGYQRYSSEASLRFE